MDVEELYGLPLERFVPERTALARALRAGGQREEAADVAALRKPSVAAWAVNQLVRTQRRALDDLFGVGDALRATQAELLAGRGDARALRSAGERERDAVDVLMQAARGLLSSDGHGLSPATLELVAGTLRAAALDGDARTEVRAGRLERELTHVGFGDGLSGGVSVPAGRGAGRAADQAEGRRSRAAEKQSAKPDDKAAKRAEAERRAEAKRAEREHKAAIKAARAAEAESRRAVASADRALRAAEKRRDQAAAAITAADDELAQARQEAETAHAAHAQAEAALKDL
jgi:hypothetical protein